MIDAARVAFATCFLVTIIACASAALPKSSGVSIDTSHRSGKSFGLKSLFGFGESATTARPAPKQIWKIHKYHGIELRPVLSPPTPAKEYGPPAETYGPVGPREEQGKGFSLPFKFNKLKILNNKEPESVTARHDVNGPPLHYSPPLEPYHPPSTSYGTPVTSYGSPAESYKTPSNGPYPPADQYNKLPGTYPPATELVNGPPPTEKYLQSIKTIQFPFKKFPKISSETKEPEPLELYSPDGASSSGLDGLDDLNKLANLASLLPEGADSKTSDALSKILEHVDLDTVYSVLEFLNEKNHGNEPIDISSLISLAEYIPSLEKNQPHFDLGSLIKSIPDFSGHKFPHPKLHKGHPKLLTVLAVLKGLKAAEIAALSHILGLGKKHHGIFGKLSAVGTTVAAVKAGKAATLGLLGASFAGVKGAIQKPFKSIGSKLFPGKTHNKFDIPSLLPIAVGSISSLGDKFKHIPETFLSKFGGSSHKEGPYPASGVPDLPSLPDFGLHLPKFPKISITGGYKLEKNSGAPYVRISYPKKSVETAPYPEAVRILPDNTADSYSVPIIPTTYNAPNPQLTSSVSHFNPDPRNHPSTSSSHLSSYPSSSVESKGTKHSSENLHVGSQEPHGSFEAPSPIYVAPKETYEAPQPIYVAPQETYEAPKPIYVAPQETYEAPKPIYSPPKEAYEAPKPIYGPPQETYEAPKPIYGPPQETYDAPLPTYSAPKQPYYPQITYNPQIPQYIRHTIKLNTRAPETHSAPAPAYETPEESYEPPFETYHVPQTIQQIRHISKSPQQSFVNHNQAYNIPAQTFQPAQQTYLVPQATQEYQQVVKAPNKISQFYHPRKVSRLPMTAYQARQNYEDYEDDFAYGNEGTKETQRSPQHPVEIAEGSFYAAPTEIESQEEEDEEEEYEQPRYDTQQIVEGQYLAMNNSPIKSSLQIEAESKRWPNNDEQYYPESLASYTRIPQTQSYFSHKKSFGGYQNVENEEGAVEAASEPKFSVVAAPLPEEEKAASTSKQSLQTENSGEVNGESTKKIANGGNSRAEKQMKSSTFAAPSATGGFSPSSASAMTGSGYSRVSFQRSSPKANRERKTGSAAASKEEDVKISSKESEPASLPVTVAESLIKPMAGPREMKVEALVSQSGSTSKTTKL